MELVTKAIEFATAKHAGQTRKYTGEAYISHPVAVATMVAEAGASEAAVAAAVLHDTLEDTATTEAELLAAFGPEVTALVVELTNVHRKGQGLNRAERKAKELVRLAGISPQAQTVKVADVIHNTASIVEHDPKFAKLWRVENAALLAVLTKADPGLREIASGLKLASTARSSPESTTKQERNKA